MIGEIVGNSEQTKKLQQLVRSIAPSDASVLITGESGCGKELYARSIHEHSKRSHGPFIPINCGAIPADLLESQLFGHKKGAFTGAVADFKGKFQDAEGGTLFLDEIGDMPFEMQVKLLRVLQEKKLTPIGSNQLLDVDVRIVAATHRNIEGDIEAQRFRQDLFFRLNVLPLVVAPLRERKSEIPELIDHFANIFRQEGKGPVALKQEFIQLMEQYDWPGNVRELSNTMQRFSILYAGRSIAPMDVDETMLPAGMAEIASKSDKRHAREDAFLKPSSEEQIRDEVIQDEPDIPVVDSEFESIVMLAQGFGDFAGEKPSLKSMLGDIEQDLIAKALGEAGGNVSRCAKLLKMQRTTLIERIKKYDLQTA